MAPQETANNLSNLIAGLSASDPPTRTHSAQTIFDSGVALTRAVIAHWSGDPGFASLLLGEKGGAGRRFRTTVGVAVLPPTFNAIRNANGAPRLAGVPPDQDASEFELHFDSSVHLDILTTKQPGGEGAIAKFLAKFGEGIQQVEYEVSEVDRATKILAERFGQKAVYPATRPGADGTRVNFFLVSADPSVTGGKKILIELVEAAC
jgi:hypothetical protein